MPTKVKTPSQKSKRVGNGSTAISCDRGVLRIQFPSQLSQKVWGIKQKYLYLGLSNNEQNMLIAEIIAKDIQLDIYEESFDVTLERYLNTLEKYRPKPTCQQQGALEKAISKVFNRHTLSGIFEQYLEYKSGLLEETTIELSYRQSYLRAFSKCPQNLHDGLEIRAFLIENYSSKKAKELLSVISCMVEWAKLNQLLPSSFLNAYKQYSEDIDPVPQRVTPKSIQKLIDSGIAEETDDDYRAFSLEEANAIIEAFEERMCLIQRDGTPWDVVVKFLFWTGARHGECAGLTWRDVSSDGSKITFRSSYNHRLRVLKGLKTQKKGARSRAFPCGTKLQNLLLNIRPKNYSPEDYVFQNSKGAPINFDMFSLHWAGNEKRLKRLGTGVLPTLIEQGKVSQYLTPYATRHTYINAQLDAGVKAANIAKVVGNSVATIHSHYESTRRDSVELIEI
ncbi:tyrosine-type recombinase/integrase [Leptolyngbya sp. FACHB-671]|uniref:tyrosine-type recombinase/integrase n=1 Tax=Leptolyngbya sp. FACHB-671 TaxID=2692812 RepID=UPI00168506B1|nr:tyrosine-type recombinase/integrase [Leptolyngbya sp. FACHB-671]MBD2066197.1 tyrosine-type recombinase/integrase [Leptolyngbya sp. FACHB-671]